MPSSNQYISTTFEPSDIERHILNARALRSKAVADGMKSVAKFFTKFVRDLFSVPASAHKA